MKSCSDAGRWKTLGGPLVIGGDNLPSPSSNRVNWPAKYWGGQWPPWPPRFRHHCKVSSRFSDLPLSLSGYTWAQKTVPKSHQFMKVKLLERRSYPAAKSNFDISLLFFFVCNFSSFPFTLFLFRLKVTFFQTLIKKSKLFPCT